MTMITKNDVKDYAVTGVFDITGKTSIDDEMKKAGKGKTCTFRFTLANVPLSEILLAALSPKKINKQNHIRSHWELYSEGQIIQFNWSGRTVADPLDSIVGLAQAAGMTPEEYVAKEVARRKASK